MANMNLPIEERNLTPEQVEVLDARRRRGQLFLTICLQAIVVTTLLTLWVGQDLTYSPGYVRPMAYWALATGMIALICGVTGYRMRRGLNEFTSY